MPHLAGYFPTRTNSLTPHGNPENALCTSDSMVARGDARIQPSPCRQPLEVAPAVCIYELDEVSTGLPVFGGRELAFRRRRTDDFCVAGLAVLAASFHRIAIERRHQPIRGRLPATRSLTCAATRSGSVRQLLEPRDRSKLALCTTATRRARA